MKKGRLNALAVLVTLLAGPLMAATHQVMACSNDALKSCCCSKSSSVKAPVLPVKAVPPCHAAAPIPAPAPAPAQMSSCLCDDGLAAQEAPVAIIVNPLQDLSLEVVDVDSGQWMNGLQNAPTEQPLGDVPRPPTQPTYLQVGAILC